MKITVFPDLRWLLDPSVRNSLQTTAPPNQPAAEARNPETDVAWSGAMTAPTAAPPLRFLSNPK